MTSIKILTRIADLLYLVVAVRGGLIGARALQPA